MTEYNISRATDIQPGERKIVELEGKEVCVFNVNGDYHALLNWCVHQGGPCCEGPVSGTYKASFDRESLETELEWVDEGKILTCPWHGWEYDITTGNCLSDTDRKLPKYPVQVENGDVIVEF